MPGSASTSWEPSYKQIRSGGCRMDDFATNKRTERLREMPLLAALDQTAYTAVLAEAELRRVKRGAYVFRTGQPAEQFYVIYSGSIKIFHNTVDGREQILYVYRRGDFVGGLNLLVSSNYLYMAQTLEDAEILVIPKSAFDRHMYNNSSVLRVILEQSFNRIRYAEDLISRLSKNTAALKVAALLLRLKDDSGTTFEGGTLLDLKMNREEMGSYAGLTRESITRTLNEFRTAGYIDWVDPQTIVIEDAAALRNLLES